MNKGRANWPSLFFLSHFQLICLLNSTLSRIFPPVNLETDRWSKIIPIILSDCDSRQWKCVHIKSQPLLYIWDMVLSQRPEAAGPYPASSPTWWEEGKGRKGRPWIVMWQKLDRACRFILQLRPVLRILITLIWIRIPIITLMRILIRLFTL